jgi:exopolysaccharide production protein ExoY
MSRLPPRHEAISRMLDVTVALILLVFLLPVLALVALLVLVADPGPVIFAHQRVGRDGRSFPCYKFRSMYVGAEERLARILALRPDLRREWEESHKLTDDPRVTPIGRFLRFSSLDELPQLVNVLKGEMSLVGPRPIVAAEVPRYGRFIADYYRIKPGLTGLWQVSGRSSTTYRRRVASDVLYARRKCLALDLRILVVTVPAVIAGRGSC